jgi:dTDP-4-amino-4,6-dideoxygalactose transaminase
MRNFGFTGYDSVEHIGMNAKMTEVCAAMGITGLESINRFIAVNRRNHTRYQTLLAGLPGLRMAAYPEGERSNLQYVIVEVDPDRCALTRDELLRVLHADRILARRYFHPGCHRMEPYRTLFPASGLDLPQTELLSERILALPTGTSVTAEDVETVAAIICSALAKAPAVREALARS